MKKQRPWGVVFIWTVALVAIVAAVLRFIPSGQVVVAPGITGDLTTMVHVKAGHRPGPGRLLMVAVNIGTASEYQYLTGRFNPTLEFYPVQNVLGPYNMNQYIRYNESLMQQSEWSAEVAGERLAGLDARIVSVPGVLVAGFVQGSPAIGKLKVGDLITRIGPYAVNGPTQVRAVLHNFKVGEIINLTVTRNGQQLTIPVATTKVPHDPDPAVGIYITQLQRPIIPRPVKISAGQIGGPSAGMMFALEIYDQITGKDLANGHIVAGTGEIMPNGSVVQIGGVAQKVVTVYKAGARIFLVPKANYQAAAAMARSMGYHMKIFPVINIHQALRDIESATS